ncbi:MAG: hypothetical protein K9L17_08120 [Clostridiales bacterium]|nr:hypothetical protein [Clostridiales bacterium]
MKIILESELEKKVWEIMIKAHNKWEKNNGDSLKEQMHWYFNDIYREQTKAAVEQEVECRLKYSWGEQLYNDLVNLSEEEYVSKGLQNNNQKEGKELPKELREEYINLKKEIQQDREYKLKEVELEIKNIYSKFFNSPKELPVVYNKTVIQGGQLPPLQAPNGA